MKVFMILKMVRLKVWMMYRYWTPGNRHYIPWLRIVINRFLKVESHIKSCGE